MPDQDGNDWDGRNVTGLPGITLGQTLWRGGQRPDAWGPQAYAQTYGNYTAPFPGLGQQVGQALYGSVQANAYTPAWYQSVLPPRASSNRFQDMGAYNQLLYSKPDPVNGGYSPNPNRFRQIGNPYPLNGSVALDQRTIGQVSNASNPFIGAYQGLTGYTGGGGAAPSGGGATPVPGGNETGSKGGPTLPTLTPGSGGTTAPAGGKPSPLGAQLSNPFAQFQQMAARGQITPAMVQGLLGMIGGR